MGAAVWTERWPRRWRRVSEAAGGGGHLFGELGDAGKRRHRQAPHAIRMHQAGIVVIGLGFRLEFGMGMRLVGMALLVACAAAAQGQATQDSQTALQDELEKLGAAAPRPLHVGCNGTLLHADDHRRYRGPRTYAERDGY